MKSFPLTVVTPDGMQFDGLAEEIIVRTTTGDLAVLADHCNCVAPLGMGQATIVADGKRMTAACIGGILSVLNGQVRLVPTTFEWADKIDISRAQASAERAKGIINSHTASNVDIRLAEARLKRALVRKGVAEANRSYTA